MRLYWGRTEPRITNLTLKIMGMNVIALVMLLIGVLYLGQYQTELIDTKLETFNAKTELIAAAIAETSIQTSAPRLDLSKVKTEKIIQRFSAMTGQQIYVFNAQGQMLANSTQHNTANWTPPQHKKSAPSPIKTMAKWITSLTPEHQTLPHFQNIESQNARDYIDATQALQGNNSISAWHDQNKTIILSSATPITYQNQIIGAVMVTREAHDIEEDIGVVWHNILLVFIGTLILTIFLSIYLSSLIARPLMRLARAAERVRTDKVRQTEIPDLSDRHDEIGELSVALRSMTNELNERMDTIESFAADVSHELKNPLTSLRSATETLTIVKTEKDKTKLMQIIEHDLRRLDRLISDISNASRLDSELTRETLERVDIHRLLRNLLDIYNNPLNREENPDQNQITINNINLTLDLIQNHNPIVPGVQSRLMQVFENILSNAISFAPPKSTITIATQINKDQIHITISDEGPGIPENKLDTIFKRFYSERPAHEDYGNNSGLGLSICKQIVTALNGTIYAENISRTGTKFTVTLPVL